MDQENKQNRGRFILEYWKFVIGFLLIMGIALGAYYTWQKYYSPEAKSDKAEQQKWEKAQKAINNLEETLRQDTYGGKTPEETLKMFVDALKKDDIELASKYFALDTNTKSPDYLTRKKWEDALRKTKEAGKLSEVINLLSRAKPDLENRSYEEDFKFATYEGKNLEAYVNMEFNDDSKVWKIESL